MKKLTKALFLIVFIANAGYAQTSKVLSGLPSLPQWEHEPLNSILGANELTIVANGSTDLYASADGENLVSTAPMFLFAADSNFIFTAKVKPESIRVYDGGALVVYNDEANWGKLLLEKNVDGTMGIWTTVSTDKKGDDNRNAQIDGNEVYLKIARVGDTFCFYYSKNGTNWTVIRAFSLHNGKDVRIGFLAQSPQGNSCSVKFSDWTYRAKSFTDFYTGE